MTWAVALMGVALWGCGEQGARPAPQAPAAAADAAKAAPPATVAAAANTAPAAPACPTAPATAEALRAAATPAKTEAAKLGTTAGKLAVKRLVVAQGVKEHEPVDPATSFTAKEAKKIYAFVEVENKDRASSEITVAFEPPGGGESHGNVKLTVGSTPRFRTWAYTRTAHAVGAWTAVVKDARGEVLARAPFEITL